MSDSHFIFKGSLINMAAMTSRIVLSPLMLLLPRFFPQDLFGIFISLQSSIAVFRQLFGLELGRGLAWWIPRRQSEGELSSGVLWGALVFNVLFATICSALLFIVLYLCRDYLPDKYHIVSPKFLVICLLSIPGSVALGCACGCMDGIRKPSFSAFWGRSLSISMLPVLAIVFAISKIPDALAWSLFAAKWSCAVIVVWYMMKYFPIGGERLVFLPERGLLEYSIPIALGAWVASGLAYIDLWLVACLIGPSEAAIYGVMQMLASGILKVRQSYEPMIVPVISGMEERKVNDKLPGLVGFTTSMVSKTQMVVAVFILCFYRELLSISGPQYSLFLTAFILLLASNLVGGLSGISSQVLLGLGKSAILLKVNAAVLALAFAGGYLIVPKLGLTGAACLSLGISSVQYGVLLYLQTRICRRWLYGKEFLTSSALTCGFILAALLSASWLAESSLLSRTFIFILMALIFGGHLLANRRPSIAGHP